VHDDSGGNKNLENGGRGGRQRISPVDRQLSQMHTTNYRVSQKK